MWNIQRLFTRHAREIDRFLRRRGHTPETAADLTQDTFLRVLATPPAENATNSNPRAYLFQVSRSLSSNHRRRERLIETMDVDGDEAMRVPDPTPSPEAIVYSRQCLQQTRHALDELPARTRRAFEMHRLGERTLAEVAQELGISTTRSWALIREAYQHLLVRVGEL
ncbi:sigma-70 family RNA polymerase sigma factor [Bradyrhizobium sp. 930_D9_N1_4]|uniref:sigma-70 family RNA polymerase sigma factor n=1 Tax=Bradyrhizobium sp. 930_D9_N1_4 TaxID=3240374 RepID=UPI003F8C0C42